MYGTFSRKLSYFLALLLLGSILAGCGQRGPLYLPEEGKQPKKEKSESSEQPRRY